MADLNEPAQNKAGDWPPHSYSSLPSGCFRLIALDGLAGDNRPKITLETYPIAAAPEYNALSYAWNGEKPSRLLWCNGQQLLITESLCEALHMLVESGSTRPLWADAICIDQSDDGEKAVQVPMMGAIYSQADVVFAWLGPAGLYTGVAGDTVVALEKILKNLRGSIVPADASLQSYGLPVKDDPIWRGLGDILRRSWFQRLWASDPPKSRVGVVQEVALARSVVFCCGSSTVPFDQFASLSKLLNKLSLARLMDIEGNTSAGRLGLDTPRRCIEFKEKGKPFAPTDIMQYARNHKTSDPIDKVYAVLGLLGPEIRMQIDVDYSELSRREYWRTYLRLGHALLSENNGLTMLCNASSQKRLAELPSWCPNFNSQPTGGELSYESHKFTAGRGRCLETAKSPHIASSRDGLKIYLQGFIVDMVDEAVIYKYEYRRTSGMFVDVGWFAKCWELSKRVLGDTASASMAFIRSISAEVISSKDRPWSSLDYQNCQRSLRKVLAWCNTDHEGPSDRPCQEALEEARIDDSRINATCRRRQFITTRKSRIGIGPKSAKPGDLICVFQNCQLPLILRSRKNGDSFQLVGEAYVYGIMHGELFQDPELYASMQERMFIVS